MAVLAFLSAVVLFALLMLAVRANMRERKTLSRRLESLRGGADADALSGSRAADRVLVQIQKFADLLARLHLGHWLEARMQEAGWPLRATEFEAIVIASSLCFAAIFSLALLSPLGVVLGLAAGILIGAAALAWAIRRRRALFSDQLAPMLQMIAGGLRAGFSFLQAFELVAKEMTGPAGSEAAKVMRDIAIGASMEDALERMNQRLGSADFDLVLTAVLIQRQVGGNLSEILDTISETIEERVRMRREIVALTAQGRLSGVILALLPLAVLLYMYVVAPDYVMPLFTERAGQIALGAALVLEIIGYVVILRIVDIKP